MDILLLGQIPEAIFFALFMIYAKRLKEKRILFTIIMIVEYLLLIAFLPYNIWFQVLYTFLTYIILKILYKEKAQITDIFTFSIASLFLIITSAFCFLIFRPDMILSTITNRIFIFCILLCLNKKLYNIQLLYKKLWNKNNNLKKKMKATTFRSLNIIIFNFMFYIINLGMLYMLFLRK